MKKMQNKQGRKKFKMSSSLMKCFSSEKKKIAWASTQILRYICLDDLYSIERWYRTFLLVKIGFIKILFLMD